MMTQASTLPKSKIDRRSKSLVLYTSDNHSTVTKSNVTDVEDPLSDPEIRVSVNKLKRQTSLINILNPIENDTEQKRTSSPVQTLIRSGSLIKRRLSISIKHKCYSGRAVTIPELNWLLF